MRCAVSPLKWAESTVRCSNHPHHRVAPDLGLFVYELLLKPGSCSCRSERVDRCIATGMRVNMHPSPPTKTKHPTSTSCNCTSRLLQPGHSSFLKLLMFILLTSDHRCGHAARTLGGFWIVWHVRPALVVSSNLFSKIARGFTFACFFWKATPQTFKHCIYQTASGGVAHIRSQSMTKQHLSTNK